MPTRTPASRPAAAAACAIAAALSALAAAPGGAQVYVPPFDMTPQIGARMVEPTLDGMRKRQGALADDALRFARDPAISRRVRNQAASEATAGGGFRTFMLRTAINAGANEQRYAELAARYGLQDDDAGDAVALYLVGLWRRAHAPEREPGAAEVRVVRAQVREVFARQPESEVLRDPAARQVLGEMLAHRAAMGSFAVEGALRERDPAAARRRLREEAVAEGRRTLRVDVGALTLGAGGLVGPGMPVAPPVAAAGAREADGNAHVSDAAAAVDAGPRSATSRTSARELPAREAAGRGSDALADVETVVLRFSMEVGAGGGMYGTYNPALLYRDGRAVIPGSTSPDDRGRWRRVGPRAVTVRWESGRTSEWDNIGSGSYFYARPAPADMRLDGLYNSLSGGGSAEFTVINNRALTFRPDGTFSLASTAGGFGPGMAVGADRAGAGRYRIDGWQITLTHADGRTDRGLFYRYPDGEDVIGLGGAGGVRTYIKRED